MPRTKRTWGRAAIVPLTFLLVATQGLLTGHAADWPTYHLDNSRTANETAQPAFTAFGRHWQSAVLDGEVYAEPLVVGTNVLVATENNTVYALDTVSGGIAWQTHLGTPVPNAALPCGNINPVGITGTPVADVAAGVLYVVGLIRDPSIHYQLFALDVNSNGIVLWQQTITPGATDPAIPPFDATAQGQRGALALNGGRIYIPFGGRFGDCGTYRGWMVGATASRVGPAPLLSFPLPVPNNGGGGIWAPSGPAVDATGSVYVSTGNSFCTMGCPYDYGEGVLKLSANLSTLQDYFMPANWRSLNISDTDLGSVGPALLGGNLIFQVGKEGQGYLLNTTNLGGDVSHTTPVFSAQACPGGAAAFGGTAYAAMATAYLFVPCSNGLVALNVVTGTTPSFSFAWQSVGGAPPIMSAGLVWTVDPYGSTLYGLDPSTGVQRLSANLGSGTTRFTTPTAAAGRIFIATRTQVHAFGNCPVSVSTQQYRLSNSDGVTWRELDPCLRLSFNPASDSAAILGANADLWTANAGNNQDLGIFVSADAGPDQLVAWKESGGFGGTYSPNAAFVQTVYSMLATHSYVVKLKWKTNRPAPGATIFAGAGPLAGKFSPTTLTAQLVPATTVTSAVSTHQYVLAGSDGVTWSTIDPAALSMTVSPNASGTAIFSANADLWTANGGYNQHLGIQITPSDPVAYPSNIVSWKESGGFAGTFSPNAAHAQAVFPVASGTTYTLTLQWKTNKSAPGTHIYAGAGSGPSFSPTRLTAQLIPNASVDLQDSVVSGQLKLAGSDGQTWTPMGSTFLTGGIVSSSVPCQAILSANADLWTDTAGYNQDLGIRVSASGLPDQIVAWKESGGFAGTFSPNAAFVQTVFAVNASTSYTVTLVWKTNKPSGATIYSGAGPLQPSMTFSPTRLTIQRVNCL
jgi:hypothetical protein